MPWTESGSSDEWLAEVRRRGEHIRRRRLVALSVVGAAVLLLPALALASFSAGRSGDRDLRVAAAGPGPAPGTGLPATPPPSSPADEATPTTRAGSTGGADAPAPTPQSPTTTAETPRRANSTSGVEVTPTTRAPADDPVVRTTLALPSGTTGAAAGTVPTTTTPADPPLSPCPASEVSVAVVLERSTYAPGEPVRGSTSITNRSSTTCLLAPREGVHIEDASGRTVGSFAYTMELRPPITAAPGRTVTGTFTWDQRTCPGPCVQVPAGTYAAVASWPLIGPSPSQSATYGPARAAFQITG